MTELNRLQEFIKEFSRPYWSVELSERDSISANNKILKNKIDALEDNISVSDSVINVLNKKIENLSYKQSIEQYKVWFDKNIIPERKNYTFRGTSRPAHLHLENFSNNSVLVEKFEKFLIDKFNMNNRTFANPDTMIYQLSYFLQQYVKGFGSTKSYRTDKAVFGKTEYWCTPEEIYEFYVLLNEAIDCDDTGTFIYLCLTVALRYYGFEDHLWRLKCLIVDVIVGFGHFNVGWLKNDKDKGVVGWIPIESTFYTNKFPEMWKFNLTLKDNILYKIRFSFDERKEYTKIGRRY